MTCPLIVTTTPVAFIITTSQWWHCWLNTWL